MLSDIDSKREQLWSRFQDKESRDGWAASHLGTSLSAQIFSLREARGWTQRELADEVGMAQPRISVLEDPDYERFSVATLKRIASAFDVVFVGRFVSFSEMLDWALDLTPDKLAPPAFERDVPSWLRDAAHETERESASARRRPAAPRRRETAIESEDEARGGVLAALAKDDNQYGPYGGGSPRSGTPLGLSPLTIHR